jgi:glutaredoxin
MSQANVIIYSRPSCHLCEEAKEIMRAAGCSEYTLTEINIEGDPDLLDRYRNDIPVIFINDREAFRHRLTSAEFRDALLRSNGA